MNTLTYSEKIENLASKGIDEEFFNTGEAHAQIVLKAMVRHANKEIKIFCGNLCTDVSNDTVYLNEMRSFLSERNGSMKIILCDFKDFFKEKPICKLLDLYPTDKVEIKKTNIRVLSDGNPIHFTIADNKAFRLETDIEKKMARGNFNDPDSSVLLSEIFDSIFLKAQAI